MENNTVRATDELPRNMPKRRSTLRQWVCHEDEHCYRLLNGSPRIYEPCQDCAARDHRDSLVANVSELGCDLKAKRSEGFLPKGLQWPV
jgi:hypothetical protein